MEHNVIGAPSHAALYDLILAAEQPCSPFHPKKTLPDLSYLLPDTLEDLLNFDINHIYFELVNSLSTPPPTAPVVSTNCETSEESNAQASRPAPVGPTAGVDRGKSVVSGDLCMAGGGADGGENGCGEKKEKQRQRQSVSVDASLTALMEAGPAITIGKRPMDSEQLAELARVDPKKAKRILANRESAAKSKEKKRLYVTELQKNVQLLESQVNDLINNINMLEKENTERADRVKELRIKLDAMREEDRTKDALSASLKEEVQQLEKEIENLDVLLSYRFPGDFFSPFSSKLPLNQFHTPSQQHLDPQQTQLSMPSPIPPCGQSFAGQYDPDFLNFYQ
ncbi:unnamed protein product [Sphenostylis stenocarpa]|uniref:BZIP domain-containing protein n=1 Tax=Sphenostylis stenocarpa TaxID=92480 RepID=A0AA86W222_9FABA|nr:unnamed protein product [Sphenostylis stenocarpa]